MTSQSAQLVHGQVVHVRLRPVTHRFVYPVFYVRLNLASLELCNSRWFGVDRWRPLSIRRRDYGPRDGSSLELWMRALLREHEIDADGEIWLQTFPRVAGYIFNPVSFWQCHDTKGRLRAVLAEVNNTFGESHSYLLRMSGDAGQERATCVKQLHVSPFCQVEGDYHFRFRLGGASHCTGLDYHDKQGLLLKTSLSGRPVPLTDRSVLGALLRYPLLGIGIVLRIHWQALKLWLRHVPFYSKPPAPIHPITMHQEHEQ